MLVRVATMVLTDHPTTSDHTGTALVTAAAVAALSRELGIHAAAQEQVWSYYLNGKHRLLCASMVSQGSLSTSLIHPREVYKPAIAANAAAIIMVHNHPSGDPEPSAQDREVTERIQRAGNLLGIPLLDHVIIGNGLHVSLRERGLIG